MKDIRFLLVFILILPGTASADWFSAGLHADFMAQGVSLKASGPLGFGVHGVGHWYNHPKSREMLHLGYEVRLEKMFFADRRFRPYLGAGVGGRYSESETGTKGFFGYTVAGGADVLIMKVAPGWNGSPRGLSISLEATVGVYGKYRGPGAGAGIHYNW